eukprot:scaffold2766_cov147-Skeletonema_menzelii.AAC.1
MYIGALQQQFWDCLCGEEYNGNGETNHEDDEGGFALEVKSKKRARIDEDGARQDRRICEAYT